MNSLLFIEFMRELLLDVKGKVFLIVDGCGSSEVMQREEF